MASFKWFTEASYHHYMNGPSNKEAHGHSKIGLQDDVIKAWASLPSKLAAPISSKQFFRPQIQFWINKMYFFLLKSIKF